MQAILTAIIVTPFVGAVAALFLSKGWAGRISLLPPTIVLALAVPQWPVAAAGQTTVVAIPWFPSLGMTANLRWDHFGAFFVLLIASIGLAIVQYSRAYFGRKIKPRFWSALLAFMGAMLGIALADSLLLFVVFWELTTVASFLLIGMGGQTPAARKGALRAFLVTGAGGLALLAGILVLGQIAGTYDFSKLSARAERIAQSPARDVALLLMLLGAFTKSAQVPFHFWLPSAMAAPAPVSAYLHSATMVKAGIFLIGRLAPVFGESPVFRPALLIVGFATFLVGGWDAVRAWDLKKILAYSTVANLGLLTALYGLYPPSAAQGGIVRGELLNIANHALYKSALFLLVGWMEKVAGTRDLSILDEERWFQREPVGAALMGIGALTMAGFPFLLGFVAKEVVLDALVDASFPGRRVAILAAILGGAMAIVYGLKLFISTFWGPELPTNERGNDRQKISPWLLVVPAILLTPHVIGGIAPGWIIGSVLEPGTVWPTWFAVWHHVNRVFWLSVSILTLGMVGYFVWKRLAELPSSLPWATQGAADRFAMGVLNASSWFSRTVQSGGHPRYLVMLLGFALLVGIAAFTAELREPLHALLQVPSASPANLVVTVLPTGIVVVATSYVVLASPRVSKVVSMAVVGYGLALVYVLFRAPDLVITQLLVETITLVLLLLVFHRMPTLGCDERSRQRRAVHVLVATTFGIGLAIVAWVVGSYRAMDPAGAEQIALSFPEGNGRNVVNVILVDIRAADTLGEIAVLAIAAVGVVALRAKHTRIANGEGP